MKKNKRPIMQLVEILGKKWVLRILWELNIQSCTFRQLQTRCGNLSPTIINTRLKELQGCNLVKQTPKEGYGLTNWGKELVAHFEPLNSFSQRWQKSIV